MQTLASRSRSRLALIALLATATACSAASSDEVDRVETDEAALSSTGVFKGLGGRCLDPGAAGTDGSRARLSDCTGAAAQKWRVSGQQIVAAGGKCLEVYGTTSVAGALVGLWACHGGINQRWTISGNRLLGLGGRCLDVVDGSRANGALLQVWDCHGGANQAWTFQADGTGTPTPTPTSRDVRKWPFAQNSIWNMPIGSSAVFAAANLPGTPGGGSDEWAEVPQVDDEHIVLRPTAPLTNVYYSDAGWSGKDRCGATGGLLTQVPMPSDDIVPSSGGNVGASFLLPDGRTIVQTQPLARCKAGGSATSYVKFDSVDIYGDGRLGAHGGSGLSSIGGSLRVGEVRPGGQGPRHALKVNVFAQQELKRCTGSDCFRWPAYYADSYATTRYGFAGNPAPAMKMGALLAIPGTVSIASLQLETEPAKLFAWTLQNYGAYVVDDAWGPNFAFSAEIGPDGSFPAQFEKDWGFPLAQRARDASPWVRDIQRIRQALRVVDNNGPSSIGGGGTPRQPLAPAL